ncbi:MAG: BtrH N-terminal domain-containing protein [Planctomycetales bacterium]|nr:BtrH N-terminal domain-containing protein [Planctomycetales bacterium]
MQVPGYAHFGGKHGESAAIKNLLGWAGVKNPISGEPFSEALCFGIAGGIGAGYSFCPSVPRWGCGSGVSVIGRHISYATGPAWYQGFFDRIGAKTRVTETAATGKAFQNLMEELQAGRPTVVWCATGLLPFLGCPMDSCGLWMHSFVVFGVDDVKQEAVGSDRLATRVTISLEDLAAARGKICSHKNRTLTFDPPTKLTADTLRSAIRDGLRACTRELLAGKMKTFSLPGLEIWSKMITNSSNKDGWLKVFDPKRSGLMFFALRDVFDSIETAGTGGGAFRFLFADFLDEAAAVLKLPALTELAATYRDLGQRWSNLADAALPDRIASLRETKQLLRKRCKLLEERGEKGAKQTAQATERLAELETVLKKCFPLSSAETTSLLDRLREQIVALHADEVRAAQALQRLV